jgi:colicin import membrane protein
MGDENPSAAPGNAASIPAGGPAEPTKTDPRVAALAILKAGATDQKPEAPAAQSAPAKADGEKPAAAPEAPAEKPNERLSSGFAKLAREKAALHSEREAMKAEKAELAAWKEHQAKIKADPANILDVHGVTLEQLAEAYLARTAGKTEPTADERVAALEAKLTEREKAEKDAADKAKQDAEAASRTEAVKRGVAVVESNLDAATYPTIVALGEHEQVFKALGAYALKHELAQEEITVDLMKTVALEVEKGLVDEISGVVEKAPHIAARVTAPRKTEPSTRQEPSGAQGTSSMSLASAAVSGAPPPQERTGYTKEELRKMALAHFAKPSAQA